MSYKRQVMYDYNVALAPSSRRRRQRSRPALIALGALAVGAITYAAITLLPEPETAKNNAPVAIQLPGAEPASATQAVPPKRAQRIPFEPRPLVTDNSTTPTPTLHAESAGWEEVVVAPGDNLSLIFGRYGFSKRDLHEILSSGGEAKNLRRIKPGQIFRVRANAEGKVQELIHELDSLRSLHIRIDGDQYVSDVVRITPEIRQTSVSASIKQSLFLDGQAAGLADKTIMELTDIFGWDIDFVLDVRNGDQFSVVFEEVLKDDVKISNGKILAAEFVNQGKTLRAVYYSHDDGHAGYYSESGEAMRKAFLRAPVNFTRISSRFNLRRKHPVLNKIRAHRGVDYAAPHGTPIRSTADGKVTFAGTKGGYGKTVVIQHGESYSTLYAHMSRYARGVKTGSRVKQGQSIGYVGKTGLATGPHLHYEFRVNGVHRNPLKVSLPQALPIDKKYIKDFRTKSAPLLAKLDEVSEAAKSEKLVADVDPALNTEKLRGLSPSDTQ